MAELRRLNPHDPVPETGRYLVVMRRFAADAPRTVVTELIASDGQNPPALSIPTGSDGAPLGFEAAVRAAQAQARHDGLDRVYAVDRTAGPHQRAVLAHRGDHGCPTERLADSGPG